MEGDRTVDAVREPTDLRHAHEERNSVPDRGSIAQGHVTSSCSNCLLQQLIAVVKDQGSLQCLHHSPTASNVAHHSPKSRNQVMHQSSKQEIWRPTSSSSHARGSPEDPSMPSHCPQGHRIEEVHCEDCGKAISKAVRARKNRRAENLEACFGFLFLVFFCIVFLIGMATVCERLAWWLTHV